MTDSVIKWTKKHAQLERITKWPYAKLLKFINYQGNENKAIRYHYLPKKKKLYDMIKSENVKYWWGCV